ncbi:MAG TPA: DUF5753 domain-containing protein, partial [Pseudonocardiaceae bacterium]|nr:DUF5753 domain-containing protein [Pseudonocardiaceae bacterium]
VKPADVDKLVAARMRRASRLTDEEAPLDYAAVVSESAFRRALGEAEIGPAQLAHVLELARRPNVTLHVLPFAVGLYASTAGSFSLLTFDPDVAPPFGYEEHTAGGGVLDDPREVQRLAELWELLRSQALTAEQSLTWLSELVPTRE